MKKQIMILLGLFLCVLIGGCASEEKKDNEMYVYYINADGNALVQEIYPKEDIDAVMEKLKYHAVFPKEVKVEKYKVEKSQMMIFFNEEYQNLSKSYEVLLRAAIVQTFTQLDDIDFVSFYVADEPLKDYEGNAIGLMNAQDFVQNTGSSIESYQTTDLTLFFADKEGKHLKEVKRNNIRYNANTSIERLVVEQLMKGNQTSGSKSVIPSTTKLLGVSVKDGICYVNFDSKFSSDSYDLNPEVTIYAIVNSIIENANVTKVQILLEGVKDVMYKNTIDLSMPLEWNPKLMEE